METYIFVISAIFILFVIIYVYSEVSSSITTCAVIDKYEYNDFIIPTDDLLDVPIQNIIFKSAYNCCCIGGMRNDYVELCALKNCYRAGARVLDFQIFSLNGLPVISASTVNKNEYKELYNYLSLSETMAQVNSMFLNSYAENNNTEVLFLNFRINSNNKDIYNEIAKVLTNTFGYSIFYQTPIGKDFKSHTLKDLKNKVIIMIDLNASPDFKSQFINTNLYKLTLVTFGDNMTYHALSENESSLQAGVQLSAIYPVKSIYSNNYDFKKKGILNRFNFIYMNLQKKDSWYSEYIKHFNQATSFNKEYDNNIY